jgi:hypothetical protein
MGAALGHGRSSRNLVCGSSNRRIVLARLHDPALGPEEGGAGAQASRFLVWTSIIGTRPGWEDAQRVVTVWNTSDQPIFLPMLIRNPDDVGSGKFFYSETDILEPHLRPGHESQAFVPVGRNMRGPAGLRITFTDAKGTEWVRDLDGGGLRKASTIRRKMRKKER